MKKSKIERQEEMFLAIELWRESGLSQAAYCRQEGLSRSSFKDWLKKYRALHGSDDQSPRQSGPSPGFIPINISPGGEGSVGPMLEVHYPNGVKIHYHGPLTAPQLHALVHAGLPAGGQSGPQAV